MTNERFPRRKFAQKLLASLADTSRNSLRSYNLGEDASDIDVEKTSKKRKIQIETLANAQARPKKRI